MASVNLIGNDIRSSCYDEFSRFRFAAGMAEVGMPGQSFYRNENPLGRSAGGFGFVLLDITSDVDEVGDSRLGPDYSHDGGGSSRFLPHERSQRAVFS